MYWIAMRNAGLFSVIFFLLLLAGELEASELDSYESRGPVPEQFRVAEEGSEATDLPIFPKAVRLPGYKAKQGAFEVNTEIFRASTDFNQVLKFYKKELGKEAEVRVSTLNGKQKAHFFIKAKGMSKNVVLDEMGKKETMISLIEFAGGGGEPLDKLD